MPAKSLTPLDASSATTKRVFASFIKVGVSEWMSLTKFMAWSPSPNEERSSTTYLPRLPRPAALTSVVEKHSDSPVFRAQSSLPRSAEQPGAIRQLEDPESVDRRTGTEHEVVAARLES